jgi:hypothetical protein
MCDLDWICNTLLETYNTSILDISEPIFKEACIEEAKKCAIENKYKTNSERIVLSQLIINHSRESNEQLSQQEKKPIAEFIAGPKTLIMLWSEEYKKLVYIFGEIHNKYTDCETATNVMLIEDYLEQLFKNTDVFIDFYLETGRRKNTYGESRIAIIANRFKNCLYDPKDNDYECRLSRMHYFDLRKEASDLTPDPMTYAAIMLFKLNHMLSELQTNPTFADAKRKKRSIHKFLVANDYYTKIEPILQEFSKINIHEDKEIDEEKYVEYAEFWDKQIDKHVFLVKKVSKSTMHKEIKSFIKKEILKTENIKNIIDTVGQFIVNVDQYEGELDIDSLITQLDVCKIFILIVGFVITDYYLLSRIFKKFVPEKRATDEPIEPHNIIIYAGDAHAEKVTDFLENELKFKMIHKKGDRFSETPTNCIKMEDFPQPFFSNHIKINWKSI